MVFDVGPGLGLLSVVLFLLPGLAGVKLGLKIAGRGHWLNRIETVTLSFALSLAAMLVLYILGSGIQSFQHGQITPLSWNSATNWLLTLPTAIGIYLLLVGVSLFGGVLIGRQDFGGEFFTPNLPWQKFHDLAEKSGEGETYAVRVRTSSGEELRGKVEDEGEAALNKDIILEDPRRIRFTDDGDVAGDNSWSGFAYIHSQSIAHVEFDRLEDADATEAKELNRSKQQKLQEQTEDQEEMEELEELAEEAENGNSEDGERN